MSRNLSSTLSMCLLAGVVPLFQATPAWAMNDPVAGRWITRDPADYNGSATQPRLRGLPADLPASGRQLSALGSTKAPLGPRALPSRRSELFRRGAPFLYEVLLSKPVATADWSGLLPANCRTCPGAPSPPPGCCVSPAEHTWEDCDIAPVSHNGTYYLRDGTLVGCLTPSTIAHDIWTLDCAYAHECAHAERAPSGWCCGKKEGTPGESDSVDAALGECIGGSLKSCVN